MEEADRLSVAVAGNPRQPVTMIDVGCFGDVASLR
jgi:hypothetical protein